MTTSTSSRLGLVLEGGGFRAHYTAGVLDVLIDESLPVEGVIGVSMGAIHGVSFVSGQKGRSLEIYTRYAADERLWSLWRWVRTGNLIDPQFCYHDIPDRIRGFADSQNAFLSKLAASAFFQESRATDACVDRKQSDDEDGDDPFQYEDPIVESDCDPPAVIPELCSQPVSGFFEVGSPTPMPVVARGTVF